MNFMLLRTINLKVGLIKIIACLLIVVFCGSCEKEIVSLTPEAVSAVNVEKEKAIGKKGEIACIVYDAAGKVKCIGTRCGTPTGDCGKVETSCRCISIYGITNNFSKDQSFVNQWNNPKGQSELKKKGYYSVDYE
jgi:hypothetical protein